MTERISDELMTRMSKFAATLPEDLQIAIGQPLSAYQKRLVQATSQQSLIKAQKQQWQLKVSDAAAYLQQLAAETAQFTKDILRPNIVRDIHLSQEEILTRIRYRLSFPFAQENRLGRWLKRKIGEGPPPQIISQAQATRAEAEHQAELIRKQHKEASSKLADTKKDNEYSLERGRHRLHEAAEGIMAVEKPHAINYAFAFPHRVEQVALAYAKNHYKDDDIHRLYLSSFINMLNEALAHPQTTEQMRRRLGPWSTLDPLNPVDPSQYNQFPPRSVDTWQSYIAHRFHLECYQTDPNNPKAIMSPPPFTF
ncbi:hypothetical protein HYW41_01225 [Candidatus Daviesbacteria bacterium]|nr:hypothetical protein [Candidatus Daviesbacteria bacterium]